MMQKIFWKNSYYKPFPRLRRNISCKYLIVGAGVVGVSLAYFLHLFGEKNIVVIEKNSIAGGSTGKAAGMLTPNSDLDLLDLKKLLGQKKAVAYWKNMSDAITEIEKASKVAKCQFGRIPSLYVTYSHKTANDIEKELLARKRSGIKSSLIKKNEIQKYVKTELFKKALMHNNCASFNPLQYSQNLAAYLAKKGVQFFENTPLLKNKNRIAQTKNAIITYDKIIFTGDSAKRSGTPLLSTIIVSKELSKKVLSKTVPQTIMLWDTLQNYHYLRRVGNRLLIGYGNKSDCIQPIKKNAAHKKHITKIKKFIQDLFPLIKIPIEYEWSGIIFRSNEYIPIVEYDDSIIHIAAPGSQVAATFAAKSIAKRLVGKHTNSFFKTLK